jgi:hypothetical protein
MGLRSASEWFDRDGVTTPVFCHGLFDICTPHRLFNIWPEGFQNLVIGPAFPTGLTPEQLVEDLKVEGVYGMFPDQWGSIDAYVPTSPHLFVESRIGLMRWDNSVVVAEWPSSSPGPMMQLDHQQLEFVDLANADLSGSTFADSDLSHARFSGSVVADVDFQGAQIDHGEFDSVSGLTAEQLYSTSSYQTKRMAGIRFPPLRMPGLDLHQQDLSDAVLDQSILTNANFSEARLTNASLVSTSKTQTCFALIFPTRRFRIPFLLEPTCKKPYLKMQT